MSSKPMTSHTGPLTQKSYQDVIKAPKVQSCIQDYRRMKCYNCKGNWCLVNGNNYQCVRCNKVFSM